MHPEYPTNSPRKSTQSSPRKSMVSTNKFAVLSAVLSSMTPNTLVSAMVASFRPPTSSTHQQYGWANLPSDKNSDRSAIVFLHGLGDTSVGWGTLEQMLPSICPRLGNDNIHYVFPQAPVISVTLNGGSRVTGWFDLYDWPIDSTSRDDQIGQVKAVRMLEETIEIIQREEGIPAHRIVVGGFGQGG
jgi:hypothetical protein